MGKIKVLVWDFDGTQGNTLETLVNIGHKLSKKYVGFDFTKEDVEYFRGLNAKEVARAFFTGEVPSNINQKAAPGYVDRLIPNFKLRWKLGISLPMILMEGLEDFRKEHEDIEPYDGIVDEIKKLHKRKYENVTLTSNRKDIIHNIYNTKKWDLHCMDIYHCTTFMGLPSLFGKEIELKKVMKDYGLRKTRGDPRQTSDFAGHRSGMWKYDTDKILYIGDEARDVHACQKVGIRMLGVTWGLNNYDALLKAGLPHEYLVHEPNRIPDKIQEIEEGA